MTFPTFPDLVGHTFADIDGLGYTHRHWMADIGVAIDANILTYYL